MIANQSVLYTNVAVPVFVILFYVICMMLNSFDAYVATQKQKHDISSLNVV